MYQEKVLTKKLGLSLIASTLAALAHGVVIDVKSGDVAALTNALAQYKTSAHTIQLEEGDYDLSGIQMEEEGSAYGKSHLVVSGVKIVGMGASREKVCLIGDGTCRVYRNDRRHACESSKPDNYERLCKVDQWGSALRKRWWHLWLSNGHELFDNWMQG